MSPEAFRLLAAFIGIILLVLLVARLKWHPFLALMFISWGLAVTCGIDPGQAIVAFSKGFGDILSFVGIVIGLAMILILMLAGLFLTHTLGGMARVQDCALSGRSNCSPEH